MTDFIRNPYVLHNGPCDGMVMSVELTLSERGWVPPEIIKVPKNHGKFYSVHIYERKTIYKDRSFLRFEYWYKE